MRRIIAVSLLLSVAMAPQACQPDEATAPGPARPSPQVASASTSRIAFTSLRDGNSEIYVMAPDGSALTRLTSNTASDQNPSWSPDGRRMAFASTRDGGQYQIYVMNADGSAPTRLTTEGAIDIEPAWSPDGGRIAFVSRRDDNWEIYVMNADGSAQTRLTNDAAADRRPSWSPDGQQIAFTSDRGGNQDIYLMNADGSAPTRLTTDPALDLDPAWSPDGRQIAFTSYRDGNPEIYVMNADGSAPTRLTNAPAEDAWPSWSSDGSQIAFMSTGEGSYHIHVMNADGSAPTRLTVSAGDLQPSWSPAGGAPTRALVFVTQPPGSVEANVVVSPPVQVAVQDSLGNPVPGATDTVTLVLDVNPYGANLLGTTTVVAVDGIATFADLAVDRPGGGYTLVATAPGLAGATSAPFAAHVSFAAVDAGGWHACGITTRGAGYCWGENLNGQIGDGTTDRRTTPAPVEGGLRFTTISADGYYHTCGLTPDGTAYCWGANFFGQLGDGTTTSRSSPAPVAGGLTFTTINVGGGHTCGVTTDGAAYCWGYNGAGQLGDGTTTDRATPVPVAGGLSFTTISAGAAHTCGVTMRVTACWGENDTGQLGDGTRVSRSLPLPVAGLAAFATVSAGYSYSCGVTTDGAAYCWGLNFNGQLGDGTTTDRATPVPVAGGLSFSAIDTAPEGAHTCGVTTSGTGYCWGLNYNGQLGNGTGTLLSTTPTPVVGGLTFATIDPGGSHTCGKTTGGAAYCWGWNQAGQVGDGTTTARTMPVPVVQ